MADAARDLLLEEYQAAQDTYLHYDSFRWQAGSFLTAGVFLFWGLLITQIELPARVAATGATLVTLLIPIWILFAHHYRQLYLCKLARIREIKETLDFKQHRRFVGSGVNGIRYKTFGPKGHNLDLFVYALTSITGTVLGFAQGQASLWLLLPIPIVVLVSANVLRNERRIHTLLAHLAATKRHSQTSGHE